MLHRRQGDESQLKSVAVVETEPRVARALVSDLAVGPIGTAAARMSVVHDVAPAAALFPN
jgi:hypothetical protein